MLRSLREHYVDNYFANVEDIGNNVNVVGKKYLNGEFAVAWVDAGGYYIH